ncbi:hypothetical protein EJP02_447 [Escherichia phage EJP2]|nr:hypothetical protein EJP02_447 [Escherichia phage EJP2]
MILFFILCSTVVYTLFAPKKSTIQILSEEINKSKSKSNKEK